jgi:hypothetical protein
MTNKKELRTERGIKGGALYKAEVPENGYCWAEEIKLNEPTQLTSTKWLVETVSGIQRIVLPFSDPNLLKSFLHLCESFSEETILQFANTYGSLGHGVGYYHEGYKDFRQAERVEDWEHETSEFYRLWKLWELVKMEDRQKLSKYVKWTGDRFTIKFLKGGFSRSINNFNRLSPSSTIVIGDVVSPMRIYIEIKINERMKSHISPAIFHFMKSNIYIVPDCLISSLYLAFAFETYGFMLERRPPKLCKNCKTVFVPKHGRTAYCSDNCKWVFNKRQQRITKSQRC